MKIVFKYINERGAKIYRRTTPNEGTPKVPQGQGRGCR